MGNSIGDVMYNAALIHEAQRQRKKDEEDRAYDLQKRKLEQDKYALDLADYQERKAEAQRRREKEETEWEWKKTDREQELKDLEEKKTAERASAFLKPFTPTLGLNENATARVLSGGVPMAPIAAAFGATMPGMSGLHVAKAIQANMPDIRFSMEGVQTQKDRDRAFSANQAIAQKKAEIAAGVRSVGRGGRGATSGNLRGPGSASPGKEPTWVTSIGKLPLAYRKKWIAESDANPNLTESEFLKRANEAIIADWEATQKPQTPAPPRRPAGPPPSPAESKAIKDAALAEIGGGRPFVGGGRISAGIDVSSLPVQQNSVYQVGPGKEPAKIVPPTTDVSGPSRADLTNGITPPPPTGVSPETLMAFAQNRGLRPTGPDAVLSGTPTDQDFADRFSHVANKVFGITLSPEEVGEAIDVLHQRMAFGRDIASITDQELADILGWMKASSTRNWALRGLGNQVKNAARIVGGAVDSAAKFFTPDFYGK